MSVLQLPSKRRLGLLAARRYQGRSPSGALALVGHPALSGCAWRRTFSSSGASDKDAAKGKATKLDFQDARAAFDSKGSLELFRTWAIYKFCAIGLIVRNCDTLYSFGTKIVGKTLTHGVLRHTFFNHFCAGESSTQIVPKMEFLRSHGIGGILDYAAEADEDDVKKQAAQPKMHANEEESTVGAPLSSRKYDYQGEAHCDANTEIFLDAVHGVKDACPDGFAAIKLSGLGNPILLQRMSSLLVEIVVFFRNLSVEDDLEDISRGTPYHLIDRSFKLDFAAFSKGWKRFFVVKSEDELRKIFNDIDDNKDGLINYMDWSKTIRLSQINELVRTCTTEGPLFRAALDEEEVALYLAMCDRVQKIMDLAQKLGVRVMVDAEWMDIQPAIDHIVLFLQRKYNHGDEPIVFNTYQTYLKGMENRVKRDLDRSRREGWRFGAKVVRGAYMVSERKKAEERRVESPICETYEDTEVEFHAAVDAILAHTALETAPALQAGHTDGPGRTAGAEVLVASHNRGSIERTLEKIEEFGTNKEHVYFGQLLGMADHVTFTLGANGYKAYKYVPYGPIGEVVPYLIRRTLENSAILGSAGVQEERAMVTSELRRRLQLF